MQQGLDTELKLNLDGETIDPNSLTVLLFALIVMLRIKQPALRDHRAPQTPAPLRVLPKIPAEIQIC